MTATWRPELIAPRTRGISDNDYCGDPDGVVQLAHHLLCLPTRRCQAALPFRVFTNLDVCQGVEPSE